jgi:hypothetical protein
MVKGALLEDAANKADKKKPAKAAEKSKKPK